MEKSIKEFTKYERARILGARALQISMNAPILLKISDEEVANLGYDSLKIAQKELDEGVLPISINRPLPEKRESKLKVAKKELLGEESKEDSEMEDDNLVQELAEEEEFEDDSSDSFEGE